MTFFCVEAATCKVGFNLLQQKALRTPSLVDVASVTFLLADMLEVRAELRHLHRKS